MLEAELEALRDQLRGESVAVLRSRFLADPALVTQQFELWRYAPPATLLCWAISFHRSDAAQLLLELGADPAPVPDHETRPQHQLPLNHAIEWRHRELIRLLIAAGASFQSVYHGNVLDEVLSNNDMETLEFLIALGFDIREFEQASKASILCRMLNERVDQEVKPFRERLALRLIDLGADIHHGRSPLKSALKSGLYGLAQQLLSLGACSAGLLSTDEQLPEYLVYADPALVRLLVPPGYDCNSVDKWGQSAIHLEASSGTDEGLRNLLSLGADINRRAQNEQGDTPLFCAMRHNRKDLATFLLDAGADPNATNAEGLTAVDFSRKLSGWSKFLKQIQTRGGLGASELALQAAPDAAPTLPPGLIDAREAWSDLALQYLQALPTGQIAAWATFIDHCREIDASQPSKRWTQAAERHLDTIGRERFLALVMEWLPLLKEPAAGSGYRDGFSANNVRVLKGLMWSSALAGSRPLAACLRLVAKDCLKKVWGQGIREAKLGNAALQALSMMKDEAGVESLSILHATTKYRPAWVNIDRVFSRVAKERGITVQELAQLAAPDYGLDRNGRLEQKIGGFTARLALAGVGEVHVDWLNEAGAPQKTLPASLKKSHAAEVKGLQGLVKDLQAATSAQALRLEQFFLRKDGVAAGAWRDKYLDHPVVGHLARRLIWRLAGTSGQVQDLLPHDDGFVDRSGAAAVPGEFQEARPWHPTFSSAAEVQQWRSLLGELQVTQPFKQAHREVYLLTDAERATGDRSLRFASHVLKQGQLHALAEQRGWKQNRGGNWDSGGEDAWKDIAAHGIRVTLRATGISELGTTDMGIYNCVGTHEVAYIHLDSNIYHNLPLRGLDPLLFSETLRDVDLFVGVAGVGNDPAWQYRDQVAGYWQHGAFGDLAESAQVRRSVIATLIPKLKIADRLQLGDRYLRVKGKLREYKIHLGSSNILMEPNDEYLCIVPSAASMDAMYLPFEGDRTLSLILSKALMLAADDKIKDRSILSQIKR